jgi:Domain of unknown function (DUF4424)
MKRFIAAAALLALSPSASANDSSAAVGVGGLELRQNDAISMDSEDLFTPTEAAKTSRRWYPSRYRRFHGASRYT